MANPAQKNYEERIRKADEEKERQRTDLLTMRREITRRLLTETKRRTAIGGIEYATEYLTMLSSIAMDIAGDMRKVI